MKAQLGQRAGLRRARRSARPRSRPARRARAAGAPRTSLRRATGEPGARTVAAPAAKAASARAASARRRAGRLPTAARRRLRAKASAVSARERPRIRVLDADVGRPLDRDPGREDPGVELRVLGDREVLAEPAEGLQQAARVGGAKALGRPRGRGAACVTSAAAGATPARAGASPAAPSRRQPLRRRPQWRARRAAAHPGFATQSAARKATNGAVVAATPALRAAPGRRRDGAVDDANAGEGGRDARRRAAPAGVRDHDLERNVLGDQGFQRRRGSTARRRATARRPRVWAKASLIVLPARWLGRLDA